MGSWRLGNSTVWGCAGCPETRGGGEPAGGLLKNPLLGGGQLALVGLRWTGRGPRVSLIGLP